MPQFPLLLLDANVIIAAHELDIWQQLIEKCKISITATVKSEAEQWWDENSEPHLIDWDEDIKKVDCINVPQTQILTFLKRFGPTYLDKIDAGEAESLAFLCCSTENWLIASGDAIVFKVLGCLSRSEQGKSLEEILKKIGLSRRVKQQYTKEYRLRYTLEGEKDKITGMGLKSQF